MAQPKCPVCRWPAETIEALGHHAAGCRERRIADAALDLYAALAHTEGALTALIKDVEAMTDWTHRSLGIERKAMFAKILSDARAALRKADGDAA